MAMLVRSMVVVSVSFLTSTITRGLLLTSAELWPLSLGTLVSLLWSTPMARLKPLPSPLHRSTPFRLPRLRSLLQVIQSSPAIASPPPRPRRPRQLGPRLPSSRDPALLVSSAHPLASLLSTLPRRWPVKTPQASLTTAHAPMLTLARPSTASARSGARSRPGSPTPRSSKRTLPATPACRSQDPLRARAARASHSGPSMSLSLSSSSLSLL